MKANGNDNIMIAQSGTSDQKQRGTTSRVVATTPSRSVSMISRSYNPNPMIDVRRRW
jgi:hypothetical protein